MYTVIEKKAKKRTLCSYDQSFKNVKYYNRKAMVNIYYETELPAHIWSMFSGSQLTMVTNEVLVKLTNS